VSTREGSMISACDLSFLYDAVDIHVDSSVTAFAP
jgi:hypothetical protein